MFLVGVKEDNGWITSRWHLTYRVGWEQICKGVSAVYEYYDQPEVVIGDRLKQISCKEDVLKLGEAGSLTIRGFSKIIKAPIMITFINQLQAVDVMVPIMTDGEFASADYQQFNTSLCQYMDSIELAMYR